jgi:DNA invertase Pin-like site-specific DNA recombinase
MMKAVNAKEFDMVATWSVDRLGRSLTDLLGILQGLHEKGVGLFLHQQGLDTSTTAGKPSISVSRIGDSASVQAATRVNAEQASKRTMCRRTKWKVFAGCGSGHFELGVLNCHNLHQGVPALRAEGKLFL